MTRRPELRPDVEVRRSARRRRTVSAHREGDRFVVLVPQRMSNAAVAEYVEELVSRLEERERRAIPTDDQLHARAAALSRRWLPGAPQPASVRWVTNQRQRWGSCTPADRTIRLSHRLRGMPDYVIDYVLLHELAHLLVAGHGANFEALVSVYPRLVEARAFLDGCAFRDANRHAWADDRSDEFSAVQRTDDNERSIHEAPPGMLF